MQTAARAIATRHRRSPCPSFRIVLTQISKAILGSNIRLCEKSFAASVPSGSSEPQKGRKTSKQDRRAIVESFVNKFRASNSGRFPYASHVRRETGGSYYVVKLIVQELVYNDKHFPPKNIKETPRVEAEKVTCPISVVKEEPSVAKAEDILSPTADKIPEESGDTCIKNIQVNTESDKEDVASSLAEERLLNNDQDSCIGQETKAPTDSTAQADVSVSLKSKVAVETPCSLTGVIEGKPKNISPSIKRKNISTESLENAPGPRVDLTEQQKTTKQEELTRGAVLVVSCLVVVSIVEVLQRSSSSPKLHWEVHEASFQSAEVGGCKVKRAVIWVFPVTLLTPEEQVCVLMSQGSRRVIANGNLNFSATVGQLFITSWEPQHRPHHL